MPFMALRHAGHANLERVSSASASHGCSDRINRVPPSKHRPSHNYVPTVSCPSPVLFFAVAAELCQLACMREAIPYQFHVPTPTLSHPLSTHPHLDLNHARSSSKFELHPATTLLRPITALTMASPILNVSSRISCTTSAA